MSGVTVISILQERNTLLWRWRINKYQYLYAQKLTGYQFHSKSYKLKYSEVFLVPTPCPTSYLPITRYDDGSVPDKSGTDPQEEVHAQFHPRCLPCEDVLQPGKDNSGGKDMQHHTIEEDEINHDNEINGHAAVPNSRDNDSSMSGNVIDQEDTKSDSDNTSHGDASDQADTYSDSDTDMDKSIVNIPKVKCQEDTYTTKNSKCAVKKPPHRKDYVLYQLSVLLELILMGKYYS